MCDHFLTVCSLSLWERVRVRAYRAEQKKKDFLLLLHSLSFAPSPQPSPKGRGSSTNARLSRSACAIANRSFALHRCGVIIRAHERDEEGKDLRAHDQPPERLPPLPQRTRGRRNQNCFVAGTCRAIQSEFRANPQRPWLFRRIRRARDGVFH